jgi:hypothetical protein
MADLTPGTRIRHLQWRSTGKIRVAEGLVSAKWDGSFVEDEISDEGVVYPEDVEIIQDGAS